MASIHAQTHRKERLMHARNALLTAAALAIGGTALMQSVSLADTPTTVPTNVTTQAIPVPPPTPSLGGTNAKESATAPVESTPLTPAAPATAAAVTPSTTTQPIATPSTMPATTIAQTSNGPTVAPAPIGQVLVTSDLDRDRDQIAPPLGANTYTIGPNQIESTPEGDNATFQQVILRSPGVVEDSYGQIHVRGEHANLTYRLNGILLPDTVNTFSQAINTRLIQSSTLIDGSLPAQFGFRTAGIVDVTSKSGDTLNANEISIYGGGNNTFQPSIQLGGTKGNFDYFVTVDGLHNDLGIENTTASAQAIHDDTNQQHFFSYLSDRIDSTSRISLLANFSNADFQIPDTAGLPALYPLAGHPNAAFANSAGIDENQNEQEYYTVVAYQKSTDKFSMQAAYFTQYGAIHFTPDPVNDLIFQGVAGEVHNDYFTNGVQFDSSYILNDQHTIRAGFLGNFTSERLDTNTNVFATDPLTGAVSSDVPVYIQNNSGNHGVSAGVYIQDEFSVTKKLTLNYGLRYDRFDTNFSDTGQVSPRVNLVYKFDNRTTAHAGYSRFFVPPPLQYVGNGTINHFANTTNAPENFVSDPLKVERSNYYDAGIAHQFTKAWTVNVDGYYKDAHNLVDNGQFGDAVIITPFNYRLGQVFGAELSSTYTQGPLSAFGNFSYVNTLGKDIVSQQYLFDNDELAYIKNHYIKLDHEGQYTASLGVSYKVSKELSVYTDALYGSGLRSGFANLQKEPEYFPIYIGAEYRFHVAGTEKNVVKFRVDVVNVFNEQYQIRSGTGVGVEAAQYGERRTFLAGVSYDF
jgi:outer membrane receptor protein involved in Fe transport